MKKPTTAQIDTFLVELKADLHQKTTDSGKQETLDLLDYVLSYVRGELKGS